MILMENLPDINDRIAALTTFDRNIVVTAGAGTGKTTLLVDRIIYLLMRGHNPLKITDIVALTFTNKAANEMKVRLKDRLIGLAKNPDVHGAGSSDDPLLRDIMERYGLNREIISERANDAIIHLEKAQICTMHSFSAYILRLYPLETGVDPRFEEDEGFEFENLFEYEWEDWLDTELSSNSIVREDWRKVLHQLSLESLKDFARRLCHEDIPLEVIRKTSKGAGYDEDIRDWLEGKKDRAHILLTKYEGKRKIEKLLDSAYDVIRAILSSRDIRPIDESVPSGRPPAGWDPEDFKEAKEIVRSAIILSSIYPEEIKTVLNLLLPFVTGFRNKFMLSGHVSFDGLLACCRDLLRTRPRIREELKGCIKAILVDEFQDTDPVQYEIILYLSEATGQCKEDWQDLQLTRGKLFIVGDPKQSIYAFRKADIEAYSRVVEKILSNQQGLRATLSTNFRSNRVIIDVVNNLFCQVIKQRDRLQPQYEDLGYFPGHKATLPLQRVEMRIIDGRNTEDMNALKATESEAEAIGKWLKEEVLGREIVPDADQEKTLIKPGDVAILFRKLTDVHHYLEVLRRYEIPYVVEGEKHFYSTQEVIDFVNLLRAVDNPFDRLALVGVLRSAVGGLSDVQIYEMNRKGLLDYRSTEVDKGNLFELYECLRQLNRETGLMPVADAVDHVFERLPLLELAASSYHGEQAVSNLIKIRKIAESLGDRADLTIKGLTSLLEKKIYGMEEEGERLLAEETVDAVRILSIHKAKGLEFPVVILAGMHTSIRKGEDSISVMYDWYSHEAGFKVESHRNPASVMLNEKMASRDEEEQKRLFYVAMTRAREYLVLSGTLYGRETQGSFISMLQDVIGDSFADKSINEVTIGSAKIMQSLIDPDEGTPNYRGKISKGLSRESDDKARHRMMGPGETDLLLDLWKSRDDRYTDIKSRDLFLSPSKLEERRSSSKIKAVMESGTEVGERDRAILIGTLTHQVLEQWDFRDSISMIIHLIEETCRKSIPNRYSHEVEQIIAEINNMLTGFSASPAYDELRKATIIGREVPFTLHNNGQIMEGVIDLIYRDDDGLYLADYKTDHILEEDIPSKMRDYVMAGKIYTDAAERCLAKKIDGFRLIFIRLGKSIGLDLS